MPRKLKLPLARVGLVATGTCGASGILLCALRGIVGFSECAHDSELPLIAAPPLSGMC